VPAAGRYDRIIRIQHAVEVQDDTGQPTLEWQLYLERWSLVNHIFGRELRLAQQLVSNIDTQFILRYDQQIRTVTADETFRVSFENRLYDIKTSQELTQDGRRRTWNILARARTEAAA
jgi:SPP1 family predicted phage head-tail adaptor